MLDYVGLRPGRGFRPTNAAFYYGQRLVTRPGLRRLMASAVAAGVNLRHSTASPATATSAEEAEAVSGVLAELARDGYARLSTELSPSALATITAFLADKEIVDRAGRHFRADQVPAGTGTAAYPLATVLECPHVLEFANHSAVLRIARRYLGCEPTLSSIGLRWSYPTANEGEDIRRFHRDPDDWRFLKLFVYLTDVDSSAGPHVFVAGSHRTAGRLFARPYTSEEIKRRYGEESLRTITGPRGTTFMADTYGIHKGAVPTGMPRLILQMQYSLLPIFAFRYRPASIKQRPALDPYINRLLIAPCSGDTCE